MFRPSATLCMEYSYLQGLAALSSGDRFSFPTSEHLVEYQDNSLPHRRHMAALQSPMYSTTRIESV